MFLLLTERHAVDYYFVVQFRSRESSAWLRGKWHINLYTQTHRDWIVFFALPSIDSSLCEFHLTSFHSLFAVIYLKTAQNPRFWVWCVTHWRIAATKVTRWTNEKKKSSPFNGLCSGPEQAVRIVRLNEKKKKLKNRIRINHNILSLRVSLLFSFFFHLLFIYFLY